MKLSLSNANGFPCGPCEHTGTHRPGLRSAQPLCHTDYLSSDQDPAPASRVPLPQHHAKVRCWRTPRGRPPRFDNKARRGLAKLPQQNHASFRGRKAGHKAPQSWARAFLTGTGGRAADPDRTDPSPHTPRPHSLLEEVLEQLLALLGHLIAQLLVLLCRTRAADRHRQIHRSRCRLAPGPRPACHPSRRSRAGEWATAVAQSPAFPPRFSSSHSGVFAPKASGASGPWAGSCCAIPYAHAPGAWRLPLKAGGAVLSVKLWVPRACGGETRSVDARWVVPKCVRPAGATPMAALEPGAPSCQEMAALLWLPSSTHSQSVYSWSRCEVEQWGCSRPGRRPRVPAAPALEGRLSLGSKGTCLLRRPQGERAHRERSANSPGRNSEQLWAGPSAGAWLRAGRAALACGLPWGGVCQATAAVRWQQLASDTARNRSDGWTARNRSATCKDINLCPCGKRSCS